MRLFDIVTIRAFHNGWFCQAMVTASHEYFTFGYPSLWDRHCILYVVKLQNYE